MFRIGIEGASGFGGRMKTPTNIEAEKSSYEGKCLWCEYNPFRNGCNMKEKKKKKKKNGCSYRRGSSDDNSNLKITFIYMLCADRPILG